MSKVKSKRLGDIVNFKRGYDLPAHQRKQGDYPVVSSSGISAITLNTKLMVRVS